MISCRDLTHTYFSSRTCPTDQVSNLTQHDTDKDFTTKSTADSVSTALAFGAIAVTLAGPFAGLVMAAASMHVMAKNKEETPMDIVGELSETIESNNADEPPDSSKSDFASVSTEIIDFLDHSVTKTLQSLTLNTSESLEAALATGIAVPSSTPSTAVKENVPSSGNVVDKSFRGRGRRLLDAVADLTDAAAELTDVVLTRALQVSEYV